MIYEEILEKKPDISEEIKHCQIVKENPEICKNKMDFICEPILSLEIYLKILWRFFLIIWEREIVNKKFIREPKKLRYKSFTNHRAFKTRGFLAQWVVIKIK